MDFDARTRAGDCLSTSREDATGSKEDATGLGESCTGDALTFWEPVNFSLTGMAIPGIFNQSAI
jgi:hypothetical protein